MVKQAPLTEYLQLNELFFRYLYDVEMLRKLSLPVLQMLYHHYSGKYELKVLKNLYRIKYYRRQKELLHSANTCNYFPELEEIKKVAWADQVLLRRKIKQVQLRGLINPFVNDIYGLQTHFSQSLEDYITISRFTHPATRLNRQQLYSQWWREATQLYRQGMAAELANMRAEFEPTLVQLAEECMESSNKILNRKNAVLRSATEKLRSERQRIRSSFPFSMERQIHNPLWTTQRKAVFQHQLRRLSKIEEYYKAIVEAGVKNYPTCQNR